MLTANTTRGRGAAQGMQLAELLFKDAVSRGQVADMETAVPVSPGLPPLTLTVPSPGKKGRPRGSGGQGGGSKRRRQQEPGEARPWCRNTHWKFTGCTATFSPSLPASVSMAVMLLAADWAHSSDTQPGSPKYRPALCRKALPGCLLQRRQPPCPPLGLTAALLASRGQHHSPEASMLAQPGHDHAFDTC